MRTYTHGIIGYLIYIKGTAQEKLLAVIGAMAPDFFLAIGFIFHFLGESQIVESLHNLFHHSALHSITEAMHSFVIVVPLLVIAYFFYKKAIPFFIGMLSHVVLDLLTHQRAAYNYFLPLPIEPILGIVSYRSLWFTILEHAFIIGFIMWFLRKKYSKKKMRKKL